MRRAYFVFLFVAFFSRLTAAEKIDLLLIAETDALLQPVLRQLTNPHTTARAAWTFWTGQLAGKNVVLTRAEGDPLNGIAATTLAIRLYRPALIVTYGIGRAHDPALQAGDIVVSEAFAPFDGMISPVTSLDGGSHPLQWTKYAHPMMTAGERETPTDTFPADHAASEAALKLTSSHGRVVRGILGSANQINREADRIAWLHAQWHTTTEDTSSAHIAGCASLLGVPIVGFCSVDGRAEDTAEFALHFVKAWK